MRTWLHFVLMLALAVYGLAMPVGAMACCATVAGHAASPMHGEAMAAMDMHDAQSMHGYTGSVPGFACAHPSCVAPSLRLPHLQVPALQPVPSDALQSKGAVVVALPASFPAHPQPQTGVRTVAFGGAPLSLRI